MLFRSGLELRQDWLFPGTYNMESGTAAAEHLLASGELPTAVFAGNDEMAIGLIHRLRQEGIDCPRDISVVGFDDIAVARFFDPPLTTMRQPREDIGRMATRTLIDIIDGVVPDDDPIHVVLTSDLIVRDSPRRLR